MLPSRCFPLRCIHVSLILRSVFGDNLPPYSDYKDPRNLPSIVSYQQCSLVDWSLNGSQFAGGTKDCSHNSGPHVSVVEILRGITLHQRTRNVNPTPTCIRLSSSSNEPDLKATLKEAIPAKRELLKRVKSHASKAIGEVKVENTLGGMRYDIFIKAHTSNRSATCLD